MDYCHLCCSYHKQDARLPATDNDGKYLEVVKIALNHVPIQLWCRSTHLSKYYYKLYFNKIASFAASQRRQTVSPLNHEKLTQYRLVRRVADTPQVCVGTILHQSIYPVCQHGWVQARGACAVTWGDFCWSSQRALVNLESPSDLKNIYAHVFQSRWFIPVKITQSAILRKWYRTGFANTPVIPS